MPNASNVARAVLARIQASPNTVTVVYPAARPATGGSPKPLNPLLGIRPDPALQAADPIPEKPPVTMKAIWYEMQTMTDSRRLPAAMAQGWTAEAEAVLLVAYSDAQDGTGTVFDACDHVEVRGQHYVVLSVKPHGAGFSTPYSCYVWVKGARKQ